MKEQDFPSIVKAVTEEQVWLQTDSDVYIKPGLRDEKGHLPKAPITILHTPDKRVLVERIAGSRVRSLLPYGQQSRIKHDALAVFVSDETGKRVGFGNDEFQFIRGLSGLGILKGGGDRLRLATLYTDIESRLQINIDLNPPSEISTSEPGNPAVSNPQ